MMQNPIAVAMAIFWNSAIKAKMHVNKSGFLKIVFVCYKWRPQKPLANIQIQLTITTEKPCQLKLTHTFII